MTFHEHIQMIPLICGFGSDQPVAGKPSKDSETARRFVDKEKNVTERGKSWKNRCGKSLVRTCAWRAAATPCVKSPFLRAEALIHRGSLICEKPKKKNVQSFPRQYGYRVERYEKIAYESVSNLHRLVDIFPERRLSLGLGTNDDPRYQFEV